MLTFPVKVTNSLENSALGLECVARGGASPHDLQPYAHPDPHLFPTNITTTTIQKHNRFLLILKAAVHSHQNLSR